MPLSYHDLVALARQEIREITPGDLAALDAGAAVVIDIREPVEVAAGAIAGSVVVPRGVLTGAIARLVPDGATPVVLVCAVGNRSALAARELQEMGYGAVMSLAGGITRWRAEGLPLDRPETADDPAIRYARHLVLPGVGPEGQRRLGAARVLVVGAGGLGSPVALYLAAAGVGTLRIVDDDVVDLGNLQRQIVHDTSRLGMAKAESAAATLHRLNPGVRVEPVTVRLDAGSVVGLLDGCDVVVDATDDFATRYLLNDAAVARGIRVVHGSVYRWEGQVTVFAPDGPCLRCLHPVAPPPGAAPDCAVAGVLGAQVGVIGSLQAVEVVKLITGAGEPLVGRLLVHDAWSQRTTVLRFDRDPACAACREAGRPGPPGGHNDVDAPPPIT